MALNNFSPTLHTAVKQQEEILAGGIHHIATLQGTHLFEEQEPILPQIEAAIEQGIPIPLDTTPAAATQPQLSIRTNMAEQQEEINTTTGQASQEAQRINVITNPAHGALKGNPPFIFEGDRSTTRRFMVNFDLYKAINRNNDTMKRPFNRVITMLSYMDGTKVDAWKEEQLKILVDEMNDSTLETDENLWDDFIDRFKNTFTNQNQKNEAYEALCSLKQGDNIDDFFAKFKQLTNEADIPLNDKGTIETLKHALKPPLVRAIIHAPNYDPNDDIPWTFKQWEKQARLSYHKWKAASQYQQQKQGLFRAFGVSPRQTPAKNHRAGGNNYGRCTTSQGGNAMDVDANTLGRGQQHSEAKKVELMKERKCFYCEIKGHQACDCHKKQADRARSNQNTKSTQSISAQESPNMTPDDISSFLKDNMSSLDKDTKLSIIESLMPKDFPQAQN